MNSDKYFPFHYTVQDRNTFSLSFDEVPTQSAFVEHSHNKIEFLLLLEGDVAMDACGKSHPLRKHEMIIIPERLPHCLRVNRAVPYRRMILHVSREYLDSIGLSRLASEQIPGSLRHIDLDGTPFLQTLPACSEIAFSAQDATQASLLSERLLSLYYTLLSRAAPTKPGRAEQLTEHAVEYINKNLEGKLTMNVIAEQLYTSPSYLCKVFRARMGIPLMHYVNRQRIHRAKELIIDGTPLKEVYLRCGYDNYVTFFRAFRSQTGFSPSALERKA